MFRGTIFVDGPTLLRRRTAIDIDSYDAVELYESHITNVRNERVFKVYEDRRKKGSLRRS